jgi:hypothetical protein
VTGPSGAAYYARTMETIQTGQRVLARNPELAGGELPDAAVDPATWVNIRLRMPKPTGEFVEITLLRPVEWLAEHLAQTTALDGEYPRALAEARETGSAARLRRITSVIPAEDSGGPSPGGIAPVTAHSTPKNPWIFLTLHELEAVGPAEIVEVGPCPDLEPGAGRLVTGTFSHQSGEVFDITVDGLTEPIGCTGAHPFWSEDRQDFIPARELVPGETLRMESGTLRQITRITPRRGPPVPVFNLEVDAEHVDYVSVDGVLVHNNRPSNSSYSKALSTPKTGRYGDMVDDLSGTGQQANHLKQNAAYRSIIPEEDGLAHALRRDAFKDPGTPHFEFHRALEGFWNQYRSNASLVGQHPTNPQYGQALQQALEVRGLSPAEAAELAAQAAYQRLGYGLLDDALVPRVPDDFPNVNPETARCTPERKRHFSNWRLRTGSPKLEPCTGSRNQKKSSFSHHGKKQLSDAVRLNGRIYALKP